MDPSSSLISRPDLVRTDSGGQISLLEGVDKMNTDEKGRLPPRPVRYKDKFNTLREKYEQVMSTHEQYERELALANRKIRGLQNECDLLLDAVDIAVPGQPRLQYYLAKEPVEPHLMSGPQIYQSEPGAIMPHVGGAQVLPAVPSPLPDQAARPHTNGTNGHDKSR